MTAVVIQLRPAFDPVRVELWKATARAGSVAYVVDYVERNGCRTGMWDGESHGHAYEAAMRCAEGKMPLVDLTDEGAE